MKKTIAILSAIAALVACAKEAPVVEEPMQEANQEIKVNINITREGIDDTKATVKDDWADGDVVFIFFKGRTAGLYLEMKYSAAGTGKWTATCKNGLNESMIASGTKQLMAVYLPYGSDFNVYASGGTTLLRKGDSSGPKYCGNFYTCGAVYSYDAEKGITATIHLTARKSDPSDVLVHYDVTGYTTGHEYYLAQDYLKPMYFNGINTDGVSVMQTVGTVGTRVTGYEDSEKGIISFSGILNASAVGVEKDYRFVIHDKTDLSAYSRTDVGNKTLSTSKYIGIGDISNGAKWQHITQPYFSVSPTKLVEFAPGNLIVNGGVYSFHENQYDITFKGNTELLSEETVIATILGTANRDLFKWTELVVNSEEGIIGPGPNQIVDSSPKATTMYRSIDFGEIDGHNDWQLCPGFDYLIRYRSGSRHVRAVLTSANGFPTCAFWSGNSYKGTMLGTSGTFIFPDNLGYSLDGKFQQTINNLNSVSPAWGAGEGKAQDSAINSTVYSELIAAGAVFLPTSGILNDFENPGRAHNGIRNIGNYGGSWSSLSIDGYPSASYLANNVYKNYPNDDKRACYLLTGASVTVANQCEQPDYRSVRLVRPLNFNDFDPSGSTRDSKTGSGEHFSWDE